MKKRSGLANLKNIGSGCGSVVEQLLPTPEVFGSNSVIGKKNYIECLLSTVYKDKNKEKSGREWQFEKEEEITD